MASSDYTPSSMPFSRRLMRWAIRGLAALVLVLATIVVGAAVEARYRLPDLQPWHRIVPRAEIRAADLDDEFTLADYLAREGQLFDEVRRRIEDAVPADGSPTPNRYVSSSRSSPTRFPLDYNRTFQREPAELRGGALLLHGLTDGPYSMRSIADRLQAEGYYVLALRLPGHGTVPAGLLDVGERDWVAAVRLGMRHVRARIGDARPLVIVGYSNGGALAIRYTLDALEQPSLPRLDRLVLVSPMVGVTPMARLASLISALGRFDYFEKARWLDVVPEYNPFKYNSFPAHAGRQTFEITRNLHQRIAQAERDGAMARFPPVLTFQSLVDATVSTPAVVSSLYDRLPKNGSALVLFDINRLARLEPFIQPSDLTLMSSLFQGRARAYRVTVVTNAHNQALDVAARDFTAGTTTPVDRALSLAWPRELFSLSHVALPFPIDDPLYGIAASPAADGPVALGLLSPRGERAVLTVPVEVLMRISSNPFFPYLADRISEWVR
jgi:alpha-beta hydrolase superfamily lysophospholipase